MKFSKIGHKLSKYLISIQYLHNMSEAQIEMNLCNILCSHGLDMAVVARLGQYIACLSQQHPKSGKKLNSRPVYCSRLYGSILRLNLLSNLYTVIHLHIKSAMHGNTGFSHAFPVKLGEATNRQIHSTPESFSPISVLCSSAIAYHYETDTFIESNLQYFLQFLFHDV